MPVTILIILAFFGSIQIDLSIEDSPLGSVWLEDFILRYTLFVAIVLTLALTEIIFSMSVLIPGPTAVVYNSYYSYDIIEIEKTLAK